MTAAEELLRSLGISSPSEINLEDIAWTQGAVVIPSVLQGCEAQIRGLKDHAVIRVNIDAVQTRRRFSIAHELGHWNLHRGQNFRCNSRGIDAASGGMPSYEIEANEFAADLIFPNYLFRPLANEALRTSPEALYDLSLTFSASLEATLRKLVNLDPFPMMLVGRDGSRRKWFHRSAYMDQSWTPYYRGLPQLPSESRALTSGVLETSLRQIPSEYWFYSYPDGSNEIVEINFVRRDASGLTFLYPAAAIDAWNINYRF